MTRADHTPYVQSVLFTKCLLYLQEETAMLFSPPPQALHSQRQASRYGSAVSLTKQSQELYLEPQNHDLCCAYHPGEYKRACPRNCPGLTEKCMSHRYEAHRIASFGDNGKIVVPKYRG